MNRNRAEEKFIELNDKYNTNGDRIGELSKELARLENENTIINEELILLCELLGIDPNSVEMADRIADCLRKKRQAA